MSMMVVADRIACVDDIDSVDGVGCSCCISSSNIIWIFRLFLFCNFAKLFFPSCSFK